MIWKSFIIAFLAVGVLAEYKVTDEQQQQFKEMLRQVCKKNGNEDKLEAVQTTVKNFVDCVKTLFNADTLKKEIEDAKPNGALDEVFAKYCAKSPQLKTCFHSLTEGVTPCLDSSVSQHVNMINNSTDQLIDFLCFKDGDRIALFIAEGGPECFQSQAAPIRECANKIKESVSSLDAAKNLSLDEQCAKFDELSTCVVKALESCDTPTPGNMAESLFKYIRNGTKCKKN